MLSINFSCKWPEVNVFSFAGLSQLVTCAPATLQPPQAQTTCKGTGLCPYKTAFVTVGRLRGYGLLARARSFLCPACLKFPIIKHQGPLSSSLSCPSWIAGFFSQPCCGEMYTWARATAGEQQPRGQWDAGGEQSQCQQRQLTLLDCSLCAWQHSSAGHGELTYM